MKRYNTKTRRSRIPRRVWVLLVVLLVMVIGGSLAAHQLYDRGLKPVSQNQQLKVFTVKPGSTAKQIGAELQAAGLIRSAWAFQLYVHSKQLNDKLQAGSYAFSASQSVPSMVKTMTRGEVATRLVTILPGRRIDQVRGDLINDGFAPAAVDAALEPAQYADLPIMSYVPEGTTTLEGLLWPDSYQREPDTDPKVIVREALREMGERLTPDVQAAFANNGLTVYQGLIVTSIVIQEVGKPNDQTQAAQVFLSRLKEGSKLGSDVTANYGSIIAGRTPDLTYDSPYNTLQHPGLPPTPISTINASSLLATTNPASTDWRYFVAGDDGVTYFSRTFEEHEALANKYCHKLCGR